MENGKLTAILAAGYEAALRAGDLAADAAYGLTRAAQAQAAAVRRRMQAASVEERMAGKLQEVGHLIYGTHTGEPADSDLLEEALREIDVLKEQLDGLRSIRCPACGGTARPEDRFCRSCGGRL